MIAWDLIEFSALMNTYTPYFSYKMHLYSKKLELGLIITNPQQNDWFIKKEKENNVGAYRHIGS